MLEQTFLFSSSSTATEEIRCWTLVGAYEWSDKEERGKFHQNCFRCSTLYRRKSLWGIPWKVIPLLSYDIDVKLFCLSAFHQFSSILLQSFECININEENEWLSRLNEWRLLFISLTLISKLERVSKIFKSPKIKFNFPPNRTMEILFLRSLLHFPARNIVSINGSAADRS